MAHTITPTTSTSGLRALVLDADPSFLRAVAWALEARFFTARTAPDGKRGLDALLDELLSLDVLVLDAALPDRDALAFARLIRREGGERDLAIVVVAASPSPSLRDAFLALGVDAVVDRSEGTDAIALTAVAAVASRAASPAGVEEAPAAPAPRGAALELELEDEPVVIRFGLPLGGGWSMLPA